MKLAIIGCGSIGLTFAEKLLSKNITSFKIFGDYSNPYAASKAAGAMLNINSEIDCFNADLPITTWKLDKRNFALESWKLVSKRLVDLSLISKPLLFGNGTEIILKDLSNKIESKSFSEMYKATFKTSPSPNTKTFNINDEQSVDSNLYLDTLYQLISSKDLHDKRNIIKISNCSGTYTILTDDNQSIGGFSHVFIMAGSWSQRIIDNSPDISLLVSRKSYFGVGSALTIKSELPYVEQPSFDRIFRTPNRGGTCGIHSVQREKELYVGASSVITNIELKQPRISSVDALLRGANDTLNLDTYQLSCNIVTGYRPVIDDGVPMIGELQQNLFCLFGTKRDGFTWAPAFANLIYDYYFNKTKNNHFDSLLSICNPLRELTSAGKVEDCIKSYVENKIFESFQHKINLNTAQIKELEEIAIKTHEYVAKIQKRCIGLQPELINMLYYVEGYGST